MKHIFSFGLAAVLLAVGCGDDSTTSNNSATGSGGNSGVGGAGGAVGAGGAGGSGGGLTTTFGDDRPVQLWVPDSYDGSSAAPLMILLHGYTASGAIQDLYFGLKTVANENGILYAHPDGLSDQMSNGYWNATDACCDFYQSQVDDSAYLRKLVDDVSGVYNVDPKRIYFVGHSNGGFMSYRMACDHSDTVAAIASLAGATFATPADCNAASPVHVLQIHGTADETILYTGGDIGGNIYPSAQQTVDYWGTVAGCDLPSGTDGSPIDLDTELAGDETTTLRYETGCSAAGSATLWSIEGGGHVPMLHASYAEKVVAFLLAHPKP